MILHGAWCCINGDGLGGMIGGIIICQEEIDREERGGKRGGG